MNALKPEIVLPTLAVLTWKHKEIEAMEVAIVRHALQHTLVYPGDIPEDTVKPESRHGVASNAWSILESAGIIGKLPLDYTDASKGIFAGRKRNTNKSAKSRWTACYFLKSTSLAEALLKRCGVPAVPVKEEQLELA